MKNSFLLPRYCRIVGFFLLPLFIALFVAVYNFNFVFHFLDTTSKVTNGATDWSNNNLTDELSIAGIIISLIMIAFSRLRHEDEYVQQIRLQSLLISVVTNYAVFLILTFSVFGLAYLSILLYNIPTTLILFILVFNFNMYIKPRLFKNVAQ